MLNTATPTLQMKISGASLSAIKTMTIVIRSATSTIVKGNADIEVDNDIVTAFLTKEEANKISNGNYNISITAQNLNGEDVSDRLRVMQVKRGSMSKAPESGGGGSDVDLSDYYTKEEVDALISQINGGAFEISKWYQTSGEDFFTEISDGTWKADVISTDALGASWAVYCPNDVSVSIPYSRTANVSYYFYVNGNNIGQNLGNQAGKGTYVANLVSGINVFTVQVWRYALDNYNRNISVILPPVAS